MTSKTPPLSYSDTTSRALDLALERLRAEGLDQSTVDALSALKAAGKLGDAEAVIEVLKVRPGHGD